MLYLLDTNSFVDEIPHRPEFDLWRSRLSREQYAAICQELNRQIDNGEIHTSSWMPGPDWRDTPFQPIYDVACEGNEEHSAKFFGLILWAVMMERPETWGFGRYEKDGIPIRGLTYFRLPDLDQG